MNKILSVGILMFFAGCCTRAIKIDGGRTEFANNDSEYKIDQVIANFLGHDADVSALIGHDRPAITNAIPVTLRITQFTKNESPWFLHLNSFLSICTLTIWPCWTRDVWTTTVTIQDKQLKKINTITFTAHERKCACMIPLPMLIQDEDDDFFRCDSFAKADGFNVTQESLNFSKFMWRQSLNKAQKKLSQKTKEDK